jgi:phage terminase large subunit GpA-like protein
MAKREHRSFWIWSAYSYLQSFERIAREWLKYKGDQAGEKTFANDTAGKPIRRRARRRPGKACAIAPRNRATSRGKIPAGALLLMLGIDCQATASSGSWSASAATIAAS